MRTQIRVLWQAVIKPSIPLRGMYKYIQTSLLSLDLTLNYKFLITFLSALIFVRVRTFLKILIRHRRMGVASSLLKAILCFSGMINLTGENVHCPLRNLIQFLTINIV